MQKSWRIKDLLEWTTRYFSDKGLPQPRLEAEVLLAHVLERNRVYLYANYDEPINQSERDVYRVLIKRRTTGEPLAYIVGLREFMSLNFKVSPAVLIPRPDTEILVETALQLARVEAARRICDVGTGSGAIAVSMAYYLPDAEVFGTDLSAEALQVARENARQHGVTVDFRQGDLLTPLHDAGEMDVIVANLPYVTAQQLQELEVGIKNYEPHLALLAGGDGLDIYRRLLEQASQSLRRGGYLLMEIDPRQTSAAVAMVKDYSEVEVINDQAGRERVIKARRCS